MPFLGIEADGSVKGCPSLPSTDYIKGNVREHTLQDIWSGLIAEKAGKPVELWGFCATCPFAHRCVALLRRR
jgi:radical SAM protein with 4Fe4S-binding SPASM domain